MKPLSNLYLEILKLTWNLPDVTIIWPSPDPYQTLTSSKLWDFKLHLKVTWHSPEAHLTSTWPPDHHLPITDPEVWRWTWEMILSLIIKSYGARVFIFQADLALDFVFCTLIFKWVLDQQCQCLRCGAGAVVFVWPGHPAQATHGARQQMDTIMKDLGPNPIFAFH